VTRTETFTFKEAKKEKIDKIKEWIRKIFGSDEIPDGASADILTVKLSQTDFKYDGTVQKPDVLYVFAGDYEIVPGDYKVEYSDDKSCNAGSYLVTVTALDAEGISVYGTAEYTIAKAANTVTVKGRTAKVNYKDLKWKSQTLLSDTVLTVSDPAGKVTYTKLSGNKKITIESKTGNVKVKRAPSEGCSV
jgi:cytochrome c biogenesis protein ResB